MQKTTYEGTDYLISDTHAVFRVTTVNAKRRWNRVYDAQLARAIREAHENKVAREMAAYRAEDMGWDAFTATYDEQLAEMREDEDERAAFMSWTR